MNDYIIKGEVGESPQFILHSAERISDGSKVLVKRIRFETQVERAVTQLHRELRISQLIDEDGVMRASEIIGVGQQTTLIFEGDVKWSMDRQLGTGPMALRTALNVARQLAETLSALHRKGFVHKDIRPCNVLFGSESGKILLTGFGFASQVPRQIQGDFDLRLSSGALSYLSPEQTGRTSRLVDYRTDFYSLGVTLFEMLTGRPPFEMSDPLELVHAHIAQSPPSPSQIVENIPEMVSAITLKLLAKPAEERYQGGLGLKYDLDKCLTELETDDEIKSFELAQKDLPERFELPQRLYGRENEIKKLGDALEAVISRGAAQMLVVTGDAGVGKTSLVKRLQRQVSLRGGLMIMSKYEELERGTPYAGLLEAFSGVVTQLMGMESSRLDALRLNLEETLGENLGAIVEILPELRFITGECAPVPMLGSLEAKNRFHRSVRLFVSVLASFSPPLVIFLDDMHWMDSSSLELIESIAVGELGSLLLLGALRDNEIDEVHPLMETFDAIRGKGIPLEVLPLGPPEAKDIQNFIADALWCEPERAAPLADLVYMKTAGNPYFVNEFLESLIEDNLLRISHLEQGAFGWTWELPRVAKVKATENVLELTSRKIAQLPEDVRRTISMAAVLGGPVDLATLATVTERPPEKLSEHVIAACRSRILIKHGERYHFEHDRLQETAYSLIPEDERARTHLRIGRMLARKLKEETDAPRIFDVVDHLNRVIKLVESPGERKEIAELNLLAGRTAKDAAAFHSALNYFLCGISFLGPDAWKDTYRLAIDLHAEAAEAAFLTADFVEADRLVDLVHKNARTILDQISAYLAQVASAHARQQEREALEISIEVLELLGVEIPLEPTPQEVKAAVQETLQIAKELLSSSPSELTQMTDPSELSAMRILGRAVISAGWTNFPLYLVMCSKLLDLTIRNGRSPEAPIAYISAGGILCYLADDFENGYRLGTIGLEMSGKPESARWKSFCLFTFNLQIRGYKEPMGLVIEGLAEAYLLGKESGAHLAAGSNAYCYAEAALHAGMEIFELQRVIQDYYEHSVEIGIKRVAVGLSRLLHLVDILREKHEGSLENLWETDLTEQKWNTWEEKADYSIAQVSCCHEMMISYLFRQQDWVLTVVRRAEKIPVGGANGILPFDFYLCLCILYCHQNLPPQEQDRYLAIIESRLERMKLQSKAAPMNYQHKLALVEAELSRVRGEVEKAMGLYQQAIEWAGKNKFTNIEAIANELAAEFYRDLGQKQIEGCYIKAASSAYIRWGAYSKVEQLHETYPMFFQNDLEFGIPKNQAQKVSIAFNETNKGVLDLTSIERAANALSGEIDLETLIQKLLFILLQNAGAQRGFLLRLCNGNIYVDAYGSLDDAVVLVSEDVLLETRDDLCVSIVRYVSRSHESVVLGDASEGELFSSDPYLNREMPKSILCAPIMHQGKSIAVMYLENNLVKDAFSGDRLSAAHLISSHVAVALENAHLLYDLKQEVSNRRQAEEALRESLSEVAYLKDQLQAENAYLREEIQVSHDFEEIVGNSAALKSVLQKVGQVAPTNASVLIMGETGTGKELVARAIHERSLRKARALVKVNCAALPATLIESELFGHEKGAFTGALTKQIGRFELADGGSIFLDEIGDFPLDLQAKLLRVLQEGEFERLGSSTTTKVDVRIIAATNKDLQVAVGKGEFRSDLFYRLSVFPIWIPPLRDRKEDITSLVFSCIAKKQIQLGKVIEKVSAEDMDLMREYDWPGNVRELENVVERAIIISPGKVFVLEDNLGTTQTKRAVESNTENFKEAERAHILSVVEQCGWRLKGAGNAAEKLGLPSSTLRSKMKKLGIRRPPRVNKASP